MAFVNIAADMIWRDTHLILAAYRVNSAHVTAIRDRGTAVVVLEGDNEENRFMSPICEVVIGGQTFYVSGEVESLAARFS